MSKIVQKIPFLRLTLALTVGIITALYIFIPFSVSLIVLGLILITLLVFNKYYSYALTNIFGVGVHVLFFITGLTVYTNYNQKPVFKYNCNFLATVQESPIERPNSYQSLLRLNTVHKNDTLFNSEETILAYFEKNENVLKLLPGTVIAFAGSPEIITNKKNPFEFDYKGYLEKQNIYRQIYIPNPDWKLTNLQNPFSLKILAEKTRMKLMNIYREQNLGKNELDILSALTLGYKRELDPETKKTFAAAGAMHVLAVSGLHVGIIFWIFLKLFSFLKRRKTGRLTFVIIVIATLWTFAFITGLSPSVSRAATMFSFVVIGTNLNRRANIYNTLAGSALLILLLNPNNLFDVGFQLSYTAVFGIVFLQPKLEKLARIKYKFFNFFWKLLTVSIAAQIATFPISIFYFSQFPTYFWLSNLFIVPAVMVIIPLGFSILIFHSIPLVGNIISSVTGVIIRHVYQLLKWIESLPFSVREITISNIEFLGIIGALITLFLFVEHKQLKYLKSLLLFLILIVYVSLADKLNVIVQKEVIVYNNDELVVHLISGKNNYVITKDELPDKSYTFNLIENTKKRLNLKKPTYVILKNNYQDEYLVSQNNMIFFEGKTMFINDEIQDNDNRIFCDLIINPTNLNGQGETTISNEIVVLGRQYKQYSPGSNSNIYNVQEKGAYIKKW